jgi:hypothetical protein
MFQALYENFTDTSNSAAQTLQSNIIRYGNVEPNLIQANTINGYTSPTSSQPLNSGQINTLNSIMNTESDTFFGNANFPALEFAPEVLTGPQDTLRPELLNCRSFSGYTGLSNLIKNTPNLDTNERCGWRYKPGLGPVPQVAQGAFGNSNGPLDPANPKIDAVGNGTRYIWNLKDAEKTMLVDICKSVNACQDLNQIPPTAAGDVTKLCGYCTTSKKAVPILRDSFGNVRSKYTDSDLQCLSQNIITADRASQCPQPNPNDPPSSRPLCFSGPLSRDCMTLATYYAGCSPQGTLGLALAQGKNQTDLASDLRNKQSYQVYQSLANPILNDEMLKSGDATMYAAFMNLHNVYKSMTSPNAKLRTAAKDLCVSSGLFEQYDFCNDLKDNDINYDVGCMQKYFLKSGGTVQGKAYPLTKNTSMTWGQYKKYVNNLAAKSRGASGTTENFIDPLQQREAINDFIGLGLQGPAPGINRTEENQGVEVFWFDRRGGETCIGRRAVLSATGKNLPWIQAGGGEVDGTGLSDMVRFVSFCDLRPEKTEQLKFGITTDDGFRLAFNQNPYALKNPSMAFQRDYDQGPTFHQTQNFSLSDEIKQQPNILSLTWAETGGGATFTPYFMLPGTLNQWRPITNPSNESVDTYWKNLCYFTQEIEAPSLSFQVYNQLSVKTLFGISSTTNESSFCERRLSFPFLQSSKNVGKILQASDPILPSKFPVLSLLPYQIWKTTNKIAFSGFRTLTFCFKLIEIPNSADRFPIFSWKSPQPFSRGFLGLSILLSKMSDTTGKVQLVGGYEGRVNMLYEFSSQEFSIPVNTWMMATITFDTENKFQRSIKRANFFVQSLEKLAKGDLFSNGGMSTVGTSGSILFNEYKMNRNMAGFLELGSYAANIQIAWLHFFDRMWTGSDVELFKKEVLNSWKSRWFE